MSWQKVTSVNSHGISYTEDSLESNPCSALAGNKGWHCCHDASRDPQTVSHRLYLCFSEPTASVPPQSDVYRMLHDNRDEPTPPRQSGSFRVLQEMVNDGPGEPLLLSTDLFVKVLRWVEKRNWAVGNRRLSTGFSQYSSESLLRRIRERTFWRYPSIYETKPLI